MINYQDLPLKLFFSIMKEIQTLKRRRWNGVVVVTTATRIQFTVGKTIYNAWVSGKEVKPPFFFTKKKKKMKCTYWRFKLNILDYVLVFINTNENKP